jgi:hypothetical protein
MKATRTTWPQTIYAAALLYRSGGGREWLCCYQFVVSGVNPLTKEEVIERGRRGVAAEMAANPSVVEAFKDYSLATGTHSYTVQGPADLITAAEGTTDGT